MAMYPPYPNDPNPRWSTPAPPDPAPGPGEPTPDQPPAANETPALPQAAPVQQTGAPAPSDQVPKQNDLKKLDVMRNPELLQKVALGFLQAGSTEGLAWLNHVHTALNENAIEALGKLRAGDGEGAVEAFNRSGIHRNAKSATKNSDGTWTITSTDGRSMNIDPEQEERGLMSPEAYAKVQTERAQAAYYKSHGTYMEKAGSFQEERAQIARDKFANDRLIAQLRDSKDIAVQQLRNEVARGNMSAEVAEAKLDMQYGPQATFNTFLKSAQAANDEHPFTTAARATIETGAVIAKPAPTGEIYLINARTNELWKVLPDAAAYKAITGADLYIPKGDRPKPAPPPGPKAGNAPAAAPVAPKNANAGLTQPGGAEGFEGASSSAAPEQAYFGSRTQSSQDLRARFDVDAKTLSKRELFAKYGGLRSALRPDQLQRLQ
jgi:hypothetical protein